MSFLASLVPLLLTAQAAGQAEPAPVPPSAPAQAAPAPVPARTAQSCPSPAADQTVAIGARPFAAEPSADNCDLFVSSMNSKGGTVALVVNEQGTFRLSRSVATKGGGGLALTHDGTLLAVAAGDSIVLLDVAKLKTADQDPVVATLPDPGRGAIYAQFSRDDAWLFISEERNAAIAVIDVAAARGGKDDKAIVGRVPVGQAPVGLALSPDGATLFSTSQIKGTTGSCKAEREGGPVHAQGALVAIDVARAAQDAQHAVSGEMPAGCNPVRVVVAADGRTLWVSQRGSDSVMAVEMSNVTTNVSPRNMVSLAVGKSPVGLAARQDGAQLWVANSDRFATVNGSLTVISPANPREAKASGSLAVGAFPRDLRFMPDGRTLVVAQFGDGTVLLHPTGPGETGVTAATANP